MDVRVEVAEGTAFEVLVAAAAVADADWRDAFTTGAARYAEALAMAGPEFVRRVAGFGRFGWLNLVGLLTRHPQPWDLGALISAVRESDPVALHLIAVGGDRQQLVAVVDEQTILAAVAGDQAARRELTAALASDDLVIDGTPWLVTGESAELQRAYVEVLETWRELLLATSDEKALADDLHRMADSARMRLATAHGQDYLRETIGGVHYSPAGLDRVLAVASPEVTPVIVVVDGRDETVILHPPREERQSAGQSSQRLLALSRAVGDKTRMRLVTELRDGERGAIELAQALGAPRTTLLHHLAILRAAGLIHVAVTPGDATIYRLRPEGFAELSRSAAEFIPTE